MNDKPDKIPLRRYWYKPIVSVFEAILAVIARMLGYWYCHKCDKLHGPRVLKYSVFMQGHGEPYEADVCSLGKISGSSPRGGR